jgi:hypothetical protein
MRSLLLTALIAAGVGLLLDGCQRKREPVPGPQSVAPRMAPAPAPQMDPPPPAPPPTPAPANGRALTDRMLRF